MHRVRNVEEAYQLALKAEEKQSQKFVERNRGARRGTLSPSQGSFNYGQGESSQGAEKVEDSQQNNPNPPRGSGFQRGGGKEDLWFVLSAVKRVIGHLNAQIITCKSQIKESILD